jgi:DNA repair protein RecN (Recombination protein N)
VVDAPHGAASQNGKANDTAPDDPADESFEDDSSDDVRTVVRVSLLDEDARREELAQLAGGQSDQEAIAFANSLLSQAATRRSSVLSAASIPSTSPDQSNSGNAQKSRSTKARSSSARKSSRSRKSSS